MVFTLESVQEKIGRIVDEAIHLVVSGFAGASVGLVIQLDGLKSVGGTLGAIVFTIFLVGVVRFFIKDTREVATKEAAREAAYEGTKKALEESESEAFEPTSQEDSLTYTEN